MERRRKTGHGAAPLAEVPASGHSGLYRTPPDGPLHLPQLLVAGARPPASWETGPGII